MDEDQEIQTTKNTQAHTLTGRYWCEIKTMLKASLASPKIAMSWVSNMKAEMAFLNRDFLKLKEEQQQLKAHTGTGCDTNITAN